MKQVSEDVVAKLIGSKHAGSRSYDDLESVVSRNIQLLDDGARRKEYQILHFAARRLRLGVEVESEGPITQNTPSLLPILEIKNHSEYFAFQKYVYTYHVDE